MSDQILYEDDEIFCVNKRPFILSSDVSSYLPLHRLDKNTSGVLIFAKTKKILDRYTPYFREHKIEKKYLAICTGHPLEKCGVIKRNLSPWGKGKSPVKVSKIGGIFAQTSYELLKSVSLEIGKLSFMAFMPHEGRTHQIRVHALSLNIPILGDEQYGNLNLAKLISDRYHIVIKRQLLHCSEMRFLNYSFHAPLLEDMQNAYDVLF